MGRVDRFLSGLIAPFRALGFLARRTDTWLLALTPTLIALALFAACLGAATTWIGKAFAGSANEGTAEGLLRLLLMVIAWAAAAMASALVASASAQTLAGPALDALARKQEEELGVPRHPDEPFLRVTWRALRVSVATAIVTGAALGALFLVDVIAPPAVVLTVPLKAIVAMIGAAWNFLDYPLGLRGMGLRARAAWMARHGARSMGLGAGILLATALPIAGLLILPIAVAAAARVVVEAERDR
jgi:uncharacterized protein involved in cysteine biosynthesis